MKTLIKSIFLVLVLAVTAFAQNTRTEMKWLQYPITPDISAYAVGDSIGGILKFTNFFCQGRNHGYIRGWWVTDSAKKTDVGYDFMPFGFDISSAITDNSSID